MAQTTAPVLCQSQLVATVNDYSNTQAKTPVPLDNSHSGQGGRSRRATTGSLGKPKTAKVAPTFFYKGVEAMKSLIGIFIGLVLSVSVGAEPLLEGRVRLSSGQPAAGVQVRLFDWTDLRRFVSTTTDETGHFALPLRTFSTVRGTALPTDFALGQNYPNPFNPSTIIPYQLPTSAHVRLEVFNLLGQRLATLVDAEQAAGMHTAQWDATDAAGRAVGAGVYIYRMMVGMESQTGRMVLLDGQAGVSAGGMASVMPGPSGVGEPAEGVYGLIVSGEGLAPYVDSSFRVESGMAPVELVVSAGQHPAGKVADDDCAFCDLLDAFNDQQEEEEDETEEEEAETDSTSSEGGPDLIVQSPSVSAVMLTPGQTFTLQATVHNQGDAQAAATMLHYYRSNNATITASDTEVGTDAIGALDASATSAASIALTAPTDGAPEVYYGACVGSVSGESNTDNNCSSAVRITVSGQVATEEDDGAEEEGEEETLTISSDMVTLPPPTWVFAGDVPAAYQTALREEMEQSRAYFANKFGVEATDFTVLVGANFESLGPVYRDALGHPIPFIENPWDTHAHGFVNQHPVTGDTFLTLVYRGDFPSLKHYVVHEYFHVLQIQLASGLSSTRAPRWLIEGLASYADYAYTLATPADRSRFLGDRYTPYADIADSQLRGAFGQMGNLVGLEDMQTFRCDFDEFYAYAMSFAASVFLLEQAEEDSYVTFWQLLGDRPWEQAFEETFGMSAEGFYNAFDEWLPTQLPSVHLIQNQMRYMEDQSLIALDQSEWKEPSSSHLSRLSMSILLSPHDLTSHTIRAQDNFTDFILKFHGDPFKTAKIGLMLTAWGASPSDQCAYLLGWYKDGELTDSLEEATLVEFTGTSTSLEWTLPAHPSKLPRKKLEGWACNL